MFPGAVLPAGRPRPAAAADGHTNRVLPEGGYRPGGSVNGLPQAVARRRWPAGGCRPGGRLRAAHRAGCPVSGSDRMASGWRVQAGCCHAAAHGRFPAGALSTGGLRPGAARWAVLDRVALRAAPGRMASGWRVQAGCCQAAAHGRFPAGPLPTGGPRPDTRPVGRLPTGWLSRAAYDRVLPRGGPVRRLPGAGSRPGHCPRAGALPTGRCTTGRCAVSGSRPGDRPRAVPSRVLPEEEPLAGGCPVEDS
ncbi:hypothetical protein GCM10010335_59320 [Streptomyces galbus]|nr:hypothetical protein GCM10010335_59320 [Streptomyces galbus]